MRPRISLQTLWTGTVLLAALLPTLLISLYLYSAAIREREMEVDLYQRHGRVVADQAERVVRSATQSFESLRHQMSLTQVSNPRSLEWLLGEAHLAQRFTAVQVLKTNGEVLASWVAPSAELRLRRLSAEEIATLQAGPQLLVDPGVGRSPDLPHIGAVAVLPDLVLAGMLSGHQELILVAELETASLTEELTEYAAIMNVVIDLGPSAQLADDSPGAALVTLPGTELAVRVGAATPRTTVAWGSQRLWLALAFGGLGMAPALLIGYKVAGRVRRPLRWLQRRSDRLAKGEHEVGFDSQASATVATSTSAGQRPLFEVIEVVSLEQSLGQVSEYLSQAHEALVRGHQDLERRVAERTDELAQRNIDLGYSRATLYAVMESMNDGLVLMTPDQRIRYINRNMELMLSLDEPLYPGRSAHRVYSAVLHGAESQEIPTGELGNALLNPDVSPVLTVQREGGRRYLRWRTFRIHNATGAHLGVGHLLTDVTQEHEVDRVKSELIATVSHELRTPLTAIRASISSLLRPNVEWDEETRADFLTTILAESGHLQELIENLLDMSKIEAGVLRLDPDIASAERLVEGVAARARTLYPEHTLSVLVPPGLPPVEIDSRRMEQVLLNLLDNAVKYGRQSRLVEMGAKRVGDEIWLSVTDQGQGIPAEHLNLIFERFHRVDSTLTRETGGNGLGLAICRGIVEAHGGRIWAESELEKGTTIYVALPTLKED